MTIAHDPLRRHGLLTAGAIDARSVIHRVAHPALLAAVVVVSTAALQLGWDLGPVNLLFLLGTITYLLVLERLIPYEPSWQPTRREWRWYGAFFALSMVGGGLAQLPAMTAVEAAASSERAVPLALEVPLALLVGSLGSYAVHRLGHANPWLWRLHGVHHVPRKVNVASNGVNHVLDVLLAQAAVQLSLALAGFTPEALFPVGLLIIAQGYFIHANVEVHIGRLGYVLASPEQHRLHHSVDLAEAGHYGADLSIWDLAFGTFTWRPGRAPVAVGVQEPTGFPRTVALVGAVPQGTSP